MFRRRYDGMLFGLTFALSLVLVTIAFLQLASRLEVWLFPPVHDWRVLVLAKDGEDLLLSGTAIKSGWCEYIPPPRAVTKEGRNLTVRSTSKNQRSWLPGDMAQEWGVWRVEDGALYPDIIFYQEFSCHRLWPTFVELGRVNGRLARQEE